MFANGSFHIHRARREPKREGARTTKDPGGDKKKREGGARRPGDRATNSKHSGMRNEADAKGRGSGSEVAEAIEAIWRKANVVVEPSGIRVERDRVEPSGAVESRRHVKAAFQTTRFRR